MSLSRSRTPSPSVPVCVDSDTEQPLSSPSPSPTLVSEECHRSSHAIFVRCWNRGENSCSRCDFEYVPVPNSRCACKREIESVKSCESNAKPSLTGSRKLPYDDKHMDVKKEERLSPALKKRPAPENLGSDAQIVSSLMGNAQRLQCDNAALHAYMMIHDPTPALRQLSEYARPHLGGKHDVMPPVNQGLPAPSALSFGPTDISYMQRLQARERFEELERQAHLWRRGDEMKSDRDWPTAAAAASVAATGLPAPLNATAAATAPDLPLAELQRLYGPSFLLPVSGLAAGPPLLPQAFYQSPELAAELLQRERERLEQLSGAGPMHAVPGYPAPIDPVVAAAASRIPAAERLNIPSDPLLRLQLASAGLTGPAFAGDTVPTPAAVSAAELAHTHTHSHTHLHLHQPESASAAAANLLPPLHPLLASQLLQSSALNPPVDPLVVGENPAASAVHRSLAGYGSVPGVPLPPAVSPAAQTLAAAQQQELLYRELLSRAPYANDPVLTQQLLAQAAAIQHEAAQHIDRELALKMPR